MTKRVGYEDSHERYPVAFGDIWRIGEHIVACGDLEKGDAQRLIRRFGAPEMTYADPPWTPSLLTNFRHRAGFEKGQSFADFLRSLALSVATTNNDIYVEIGLQQEELLRTTFSGVRVTPTGEWPITYYNDLTKVAKLLRFTTNVAARGQADFTGMDDESTPRLAVMTSSSEGDLVFDPCTGHGLTAEAAHKLRRRFMGLEINPARTAVTIDMLGRMNAGRPERVGSLIGSQG